MQRSLVSFFLFLSIGIMACKTDENAAPNMTELEGNGSPTNDTIANRLIVRVTSHAFRATLLNNAAAAAFKARLPLRVEMTDLNRNEKFYQFSNNLPTQVLNPGTIQTGDLMLYGSNTLVLFYQTFPTAYSYTRLGRIDNPSGLAAALGPGNVTVTYELSDRMDSV
jgi:hypothetical protein